MADVKGSRKERAARTRRRMLDAAYACFTKAGYAGTTMAEIADRAGVAVQTLYFTFHTKDGLLTEVYDRAVFGPENLPPPEQAWFRATMDAETIDEALTHWASAQGEINDRVAPLRAVFDGAADPAVGQLWDDRHRLREEGFAYLFGHLADKHGLAPGVDLGHVVDLALVLMGPSGHRGFVEDRGWSTERWAAFGAAHLRQYFAPRSDP
ncbi:MAG TPA: TetR/AcrR family transcriptional regulator [Jiangellaceae bacterium]